MSCCVSESYPLCIVSVSVSVYYNVLELQQSIILSTFSYKGNIINVCDTTYLVTRLSEVLVFPLRYFNDF